MTALPPVSARTSGGRKAMRIAAMVAIVVLAVGMGARAEEKVRVYMEDGSVVPFGVLNQGRLMPAKYLLA